MKTRVANPVLRRELLERWRGRRAVMVLTVYLLLLVGLLILLRWVATSYLDDAARNGWGPPTSATGPMLGRFLLENTLAVVLGLVLFVAPGYAAAQIAGERERRTLGLLRITLVRPRGIVLGKLGASSAWILLLVIASAPVAASAFVLGGVSPGDLVAGLVVILVVAVGVAAIAIGVSARARRTTSAVMITYAIVLTLVLGTVVSAFGEYAAADFRMDDGRRPITLRLNPFYALADAAGSSLAFVDMGVPSLLTPFAAVLPGSDAFDRDPFGDQGFDEAGEPIGDEGWSAGTLADTIWLQTVLLYLLLAALSLWIATRSIGPREGVRET